MKESILFISPSEKTLKSLKPKEQIKFKNQKNKKFKYLNKNIINKLKILKKLLKNSNQTQISFLIDYIRQYKQGSSRQYKLVRAQHL